MDSSRRGSSRVGPWLWLFCFQFFVAEQITRLGWPGHYSMARDYISDLGSARSPLHWVMNGSFMLQGLLIFFGAVLTRQYFPARMVYRVVLLLLIVAGVGVLVVGLVPEDADVRWHILGAAANFLGGNVGMILLGLVMIRRSVCLLRGQRGKSWVPFVAGSIGLLATLALGFRGTPSWVALGWNTGTVERLAVYPLPLWLTWTGWLMLTGRFVTLAVF
jgi:hypothetical membrane protein